MAKKMPTVSVIERRLQAPNIFRTSSEPIALTEPKAWVVRWMNSKLSPGRLFDVLHNKGWAYLEPADLACDVEEIGAVVRDNRIVRGERGEEVLMKMPSKDYKRIEKAKTEQTMKQTFGKKQLKDKILSEVPTEHGDRAAEWIAENVNTIKVQDVRGPEFDE